MEDVRRIRTNVERSPENRRVKQRPETVVMFATGPDCNCGRLASTQRSLTRRSNPKRLLNVLKRRTGVLWALSGTRQADPYHSIRPD